MPQMHLPFFPEGVEHILHFANKIKTKRYFFAEDSSKYHYAGMPLFLTPPSSPEYLHQGRSPAFFCNTICN